MPKPPSDRSRVGQSVSAALQLVLPLFGNARDREIARPEPSAPRKPAMPPKELAKGETTRQIWLGQRRLDYIFKRRPRKSIGSTIDRRGLIVSAPRWVTIGAVEQAILEKESWIGTKLSEWQSFEARLAELRTEWGEGGRLRYLGKTLLIRLDEACGNPHLNMNAMPWELHLPLAQTAAPDDVRRTVDHWLKRRAQELLANRIGFYADRLGQHPSAWRLSSARTLWGTCTQDGLIRLNWRLIHLPTELIDYVVAHELAHLKELNHSARFWRTVGQIMPGYERAKDRLSQMPEHLAL